MSDQPAIRLVDYMGDMDDYHTIKLIGPYKSTADRDADLVRLDRLPPGADEYRGGAEFLPATMAAVAADLFGEVYAPERVAQATTLRAFFDALSPWPADDTKAGEDEVHPDQGALF